ncbi:L-threonylcarbamoyladenylate synthase [Patescibacteria group bacterium]
MEKIKLDLNNFSKEEVSHISDLLKDGKVAAIPTDTIYGLSCVATDKDAVKKLYRIKRMKKEKTSLVLMKSFCMVREYCYLNSDQYEYIKDSFSEKRPITFILNGRDNLPEHFINSEGGVAIRIPQTSGFTRDLLKKISLPLASTSLNITGGRPVNHVDDLDQYFKKGRPHFVVDVGVISDKRASKIVDIRDMDKIKIIRD